MNVIDFAAFRLRHFEKLAKAHGLSIEISHNHDRDTFILREIDSGIIDTRSDNFRAIEETLLGMQAVRDEEAAHGYLR